MGQAISQKYAGLEGVPNKVFDTLVMGRGAYEATGASVTSPYSHLRQYVVSRALTAIRSSSSGG